MKKGFFIGIILALVVCFTVPVVAQDQAVSPLVETLADVEQILYGMPGTGSVLQRVETVERDLIGDTLSGTLMDRVDRLRVFVLIGTADEPSLEFKIKSIRMALDTQLGVRGILFAELEELERTVFGFVTEGPIGVRVDKLFRTVVDPLQITAFSISVPEETLLKIVVETTLHSERSNVGDPVPFRVVEDVVIGGVLVIARDTAGEGRIETLRRKGNFGIPGRINVDFGYVPGVDGTPVPVELGARAIQENESLVYAVGASIAGLAIFGPIGAVAGFFIHGEPAVLEQGAEFFIEVSEPVTVGGQLEHGAFRQPAAGPDPYIPERFFPTQLDEAEDPGRWAEPIWDTGIEEAPVTPIEEAPPVTPIEEEPLVTPEQLPGEHPEVEIEIRPFEEWGRK
ncbi:MAG TPA: hypothetical protein VLH40_04005 [Atribacteraceae bacterium]|nr:hypothetical protein [Atribacteraceae bacterium]